MARISVIIPAYNCAATIQRCLDSILANQDVDKEIIVVNDCSPDDLLTVLAPYQTQIKLINFTANQGVSVARNAGVAAAIGDYVTFVDADDYVAPTMLGKMLSQIIADAADVCVVKHFRQGFAAEHLPDLPTQVQVGQDLLLPYLMPSNNIYLSPAPYAKLIKINLARQVAFNQAIHCGEDVLFTLELLYRAGKVTFVAEELYHYIRQPNSVMHHLSPKFLDFLMVKDLIPVEIRTYLEQTAPVAFQYFGGNMVSRGIHSVANNASRANRREAVALIRQFRQAPDFRVLCRHPQTKRRIKLEMFVLRVFGARCYLAFVALYRRLKHNKI